MANRLMTLALCAVAATALSIAAFAQTVVPVIIESGNSGNYVNIREAQFNEARLGGPGGNTYFYIGDEDIAVSGTNGNLVNGSGTFDDRNSVGAAHIVVAGDAATNPTVLYVFVAMQTDSGIGIRHALAPDGYFLKKFAYTGNPLAGGNTIPADVKTKLLDAAAATGFKVNLGASEVGAGTIVDLQNRFLNGTFAQPNGTLYSFTESTPLVFRDAGNNSTSALAAIPTTGLPSAFPFSVGAQPEVVIMKLHSASQDLSANTAENNVKRALDSMENITSNELSKIFSGLYKHWGEVGSFVAALRNLGLEPADFTSALNYANTTQISAFLREPPSGTYNGFEETIMQGKGRSQEHMFNLPAPGRPGRGYRANNTDDPRLTGKIGSGATVSGSPNSALGPFAKDGGRVRGDGRMILSVKNVDFSIGYTYYSTIKFARNGATADTSSQIDGDYVKYLKVDGVDPLAKANYDGNPKTGARFGIAGFSDVFGNYPIWTNVVVVFREVNPDNNTTAQEIRALSFRNRYASLTGAFLPRSQNLWLRSHRTDAFTAAPKNGSKTTGEAGNEDGGEVIQRLRDTNDGEYTGFHQP